MSKFRVFITTVVLVHGWKPCIKEEGGGVCPIGSKCCSTGITGVSSCIPEPAHEFNGTAMCCRDNSGCGPGYECSESYGANQQYYCRLLTPPTDSPAPSKLPRYKNCILEDVNLTLHGLDIGTTEFKFGYFSSMGSLEDDSNIDRFRATTHVLINIHGSDRNADNYFCSAIASVPSHIASTTLVIAPWFMSPEDKAPDHSNLSFLRWNDTGPIPHTWRYGAEAVNDGDISSYQVIDIMVEKVMFDEHRFPNLERVVLAGHSAGGQFTHRWALTSSATFWRDTDKSENRLVPIRVVAANPRSFCYLDNRRYDHFGRLRIPIQRLINKCPGYNRWEWGLEFNGRVPMPRHVVRNIKDHGGNVTWMISSYANRDLVYLAGSLDVLRIRAECEDDYFQGKNRFERSDRFVNSLQEVYGTPTHQRLVAKGVPHDHMLIFQSSAGQQAMFGELQVPHRQKQAFKHIVDLSDQ